jgi:para-aminobenzoate synthetase component 1
MEAVSVERIRLEGDFADFFGSLLGLEYGFFLDSGMDPERLGRYSFIGVKPFLVFRSKGTRVEIVRDRRVFRKSGSPFDVLDGLLGKYVKPADGRFSCGAFGYFAYDLAEFSIKNFRFRSEDDLGNWDCVLGFYDTLLVRDHLNGHTFIVSSSRDNKRGVLGLVREGRRCKPAGTDAERGMKSNFTKREYIRAVGRVKGYIKAGDIYQANLSQRFELDYKGDPWLLYRRLRDASPAPFGAYLNFPEAKVLCDSPERFLKTSGRRIETRPMKGTRPRGSNPVEDRVLRRELMSSVKDRAENLMIVDLERNDLGRVCEYGSVRVSELESIEEYRTVFQMVSTVEGTLRSGVSQVDCLRACFPGGSITGAPKVRAMEIIDELEPTRRNIYTGAIGYMGFNGAMDLNIAIRTILIKDDKAYFQVGGGIVADSSPMGEYRETLVKAKALFKALGR